MKEKYPVTMATRLLRQRNAQYEPKLYKYEDKGGTAVSARELGVDEHHVIKTIIMEDETKEPFIVLMHGDMSISEKNMARIRNVKTVKPCAPAT
ncbi:MAG: Cys-tRNA(Pro) deacylase, partial [Deferribacterales bacterium]|nr:Cys-tRNA(Pro) deacylase [Deferribacterales bacterium]